MSSAPYVVDIGRWCQSRVQMDYLPLSQRLILSVVSKIDFQSRWFDSLLLRGPLECRFNAFAGYNGGRGMCAKSGSEKQTNRRRSSWFVRFSNGCDICIDSSNFTSLDETVYIHLHSPPYSYARVRGRDEKQFLLSLSVNRINVANGWPSRRRVENRFSISWLRSTPSKLGSTSVSRQSTLRFNNDQIRRGWKEKEKREKEVAREMRF